MLANFKKIYFSKYIKDVSNKMKNLPTKII